MTFVFGPQTCTDLHAGTQREWLVTDGLGGYATGTVSGLRTRRYHGLLMASGQQPATRHLALASLDPVLRLPSGATVRLGVHEWAGGAIAPEGHTLLRSFELRDGLPRWRWRIGEVVIERELAMVYGRPAVAVVHRVIAAPWPVELTLEALGTWRDAHGERYASGGPLPMRPTADGAVIADAWRIAGPGWEPAGEWWNGAWTREEAARGLVPAEDLWLAGRFSAALERGAEIGVTAWAGDLSTAPPPATEVIAVARQRARTVVARARPADTLEATLALAADAFIVGARPAPDVVAGYPWFGVWSRDTMTAYEGLFLETGRQEEGRALLLGYGETVSEGMLANTADTGRTEYNTVDAALWYLHAVRRHVARTGDTDLAATLIDRLDAIVDAHLAGTRYGIRVDENDGLLAQGCDGVALTWMDARIGGVSVTPRQGKPVEVNALWVNGLAAVATLRESVGLDATRVRAIRQRAMTGFRARFPAPAGWLYDVVDAPEGDDATLRPNQLLAYSLPDAPLRGEPLPPAIGSALLTPLGLRSRAPGDAAYRGRHRGGPAGRDMAYHEGTSWPWLIGPYAEAIVSSGTELPDLLGDIKAHLSEWGIGSVSETADGDPPHQATGCPFQAWSVAEVLRVRRSDS
ncbi:MAG: amylo-alpha-1,6-glucosidase [Dactylosporangium sp.]|nr:amylo-alpha-1,6-glucosidase [Dactylosporangium sp.]NNJ59769.1 amylo-alpha-1,6-glucosidase [Dactylosporangium sp.]